MSTYPIRITTLAAQTAEVQEQLERLAHYECEVTIRPGKPPTILEGVILSTWETKLQALAELIQTIPGVVSVDIDDEISHADISHLFRQNFITKRKTIAVSAGFNRRTPITVTRDIQWAMKFAASLNDQEIADEVERILTQARAEPKSIAVSITTRPRFWQRILEQLMGFGWDYNPPASALLTPQKEHSIDCQRCENQIAYDLFARRATLPCMNADCAYWKHVSEHEDDGAIHLNE